MEAVVVEVLEIDQPNSRSLGKSVKECFTKIFVIQEKFDVGQQAGEVACIQFRIDAGNGFTEKRGEDVGFFILGRILQRQITIAKPYQMQDARNFDP